MMAQLIAKLRRSRDTRPIFHDRVTGISDASRALADYVALALPAAMVVFLNESAEAQARGSHENRQAVDQRWGILVALEATSDVRAQAPAMQIDTVRRAVFRALYNWSPNFNPDPLGPMDYHAGPFWYDGMDLIDVNRGVTLWRMTFGCSYWICGAAGEGETEEQFDPLPTFDGINIYNDFIDPFDPGIPPSQPYPPPPGWPALPSRGPGPRPSGPDGRIESGQRFEVDVTPPRGRSNGHTQ